MVSFLRLLRAQPSLQALVWIIINVLHIVVYQKDLHSMCHLLEPEPMSKSAYPIYKFFEVHRQSSPGR